MFYLAEQMEDTQKKPVAPATPLPPPTPHIPLSQRTGRTSEAPAGEVQGLTEGGLGWGFWADGFVCQNNEVILIWLLQQRSTTTGNGF